MAALVLLGTGGWSQRWEIASGQEAVIAAALADVGSERVGRLPVVDLETGSDVELVIAWSSVASAVVIPSTAGYSPGQYA